MDAPKPSPFMDALHSHATPSLDEHDNRMLTDNGDLAFRSSGNALTDLFFELDRVISGTRLRTVLEASWHENPEATLRIIWNARSIHLGKGDRKVFYRAIGWLAETHPKTMLANLPWLVRPLIQKKAAKKEGEKSATADGEAAEPKEDATMADFPGSADEFELVDEKVEAVDGPSPAKKAKLEEDDGLSEFDVKYGCAHGYWKDLLNILALAANDELKADGDPNKVFNIDTRTSKKRLRNWTKDHKKEVVKQHHLKIIVKLEKDEFYKQLHDTVARLFVDQLKLDTARLASESKADKRQISLAAKWAPSADGMHDNHTMIVKTIAELLHPFDSLSLVNPPLDPGDRKTYLKHARIAYQSKTLSPLRKFLQVVERDITAQRFEDIMYERVASLAMQRYTPLFIRKDGDRFEQYIDRVADGKASISGAVLLPSTLVAALKDNSYDAYGKTNGHTMIKKRVAEKEAELRLKATDQQWKMLVQRIKDSGTLQSSIAVCDVSGSMGGPAFPDGTVPFDSSVGLSLLLAEVVEPPFGGTIITFSAEPKIFNVGGPNDKRSLVEKIDYIVGNGAGLNTDFVAVFEKLLLPIALKHKLKKEDMVKQVFVFSDMQFDAAEGDEEAIQRVTNAMYARHGYAPPPAATDYLPALDKRWSSSYERIKAKFEEAGYDMPRLIFWNLAGGRAGYDGYTDGEDTAPKPVEAEQEGTAMVSGYSQGQLKMFLDSGSLEDAEAEVLEEVEDEDGNVVLGKKKEEQNSLALVKKAVSHEAYRMLRVVD